MKGNSTLDSTSRSRRVIAPEAKGDLLAFIVVMMVVEWMFWLTSEKMTLIIVREHETFTYG